MVDDGMLILFCHILPIFVWIQSQVSNETVGQFFAEGFF